MPRGSRRARLAWIARQLRAIRPDVVWVQEEPIDPFLLEMLALYRFSRRPRIATAVCENIFPRPRRLAERTARRLLWPRLDQLLDRRRAVPRRHPCRRHARVGARVDARRRRPRARAGKVSPMPLPFEPAAFVVGFAGRLVEEKGWRVLVGAVESLPPSFCLALAGDGPQVSELRRAADALRGRVHYAGLLSKEELWTFYAALDCLAVPSLTTPRWKEQSASTLVDGLAMGLPIVASDSGGIADMMGPAGLLVPENDPAALAVALLRLHDDQPLRERLGLAGRERFRREFAIPAYATKLATALGLSVRPLASNA